MSATPPPPAENADCLPALLTGKADICATPADETPGHPHKKIRAEVLFDKGVYGGISYAAQAGAGIVLTNWLTHGGGRRHFNKMAEWIGPKFLSKITSKKGPEAIEEATSWIIVSTMVMVGNTFLLPVKWLENRKPHIVGKLNDYLNERREAKGEFISAEERTAQENSLQELEKKPPQTWWSLGLGRGFALGAVYATLWAVSKKNNEAMEMATTRGIQSGLSTLGMKGLAASKKLENYLRIGFYDVAYSAVSASGLYVYSHYICPPKKHAQPETPATTPEQAPPDATPPASEEKPTSFAAKTEPHRTKREAFTPAATHLERAQTQETPLART